MTLRSKLIALFVVAMLLPIGLGATAWFFLGGSKDVTAGHDELVQHYASTLHNLRVARLNLYDEVVQTGEPPLPGSFVSEADLDFFWVVDGETGDVKLRGHQHRALGRNGAGLVTAALAADGKAFLVELGPNAHQRVLASAILLDGQETPTWVVAGHRETRLNAVKTQLARQDGGAMPPLWSWLVMIGAIALGLSILFADRAGSWLRASLEDIAKAAERIGRGELDATVPERGDASFKATATAFNRMTSELREAQDRLRKTERIAAWQDIAKRLAHEIKNPLSPIQLSIETLQKARTTKHQDFEAIFDESTAAILDEVNRLRRITDEFGRFARLPAPNPAVVDVGELVKQVSGLYEDEGVRLTMAGDTSPHAVADREQITQVLHNLLRNAIEATQGKPSGNVEVRIEATTDQILIHVRDDGPGIADEHRPNIFDPYYTTKESGSGLGLAITDRIVTEHRGRIDVATSSAGTTFTVSLPRES